MKHDGYLGALGCLLKSIEEENPESFKGIWKNVGDGLAINPYKTEKDSQNDF